MDITNDTVDSSLEHRIWGTLTHLLGGLTLLFSVRVRADDHLSGQQHGGESLGISDKSSKLCWSDLPVPCCQVCHTDNNGYGWRRNRSCSMHCACEPDQVHGMLCGFARFARLQRHGIASTLAITQH